MSNNDNNDNIMSKTIIDNILYRKFFFTMNEIHRKLIDLSSKKLIYKIRLEMGNC